MKLLIYLCIIFFNFFPIYAKNISCDFEEVYPDRTTQFGKILFRDGLLRYEYYDKQLFTIVYNNNYYVIRNDDKNVITKLEKDDLLDEISNILNNYPEIENKYAKNNLVINIENKNDQEFIKRLSIVSEKVNLSIYFRDCEFKPISKKYFQPFSNIN